MWIPLVAALIVVAARLALGATMEGPRVFPDELGYLAAARHLAGGSPPWELGAAAFYHPGYSLLLVPAFWLTDDPSTLYRVALVVNAVLGGVTLLLLRRVL
ncbi:MAG: hypothetical protein H0U26_01785, partial [Acidimicrobiia bacterium]|nr:hypothetical protein [Acidimicrobiia bacterium]